MKVFCFFINAILFVSYHARADFTAEIYEMGSQKQKKIYTISNHQEEKDGITESTSIFKDSQDQVVVEERSKLKGTEVLSYEIQQKQIETVGFVEVKEGNIHFSKTKEGKKESDSEKLKLPFVISMSFQKYVKENWKDLLSGKTLEFRYAAWERKETVGFELKKTGVETSGDQELTVLVMKPSSFIIAALVKPITFKFKSDGSQLIEMKGRVAPKQKSGSSWKDLDAEVVYHHSN